MGLTSYTNIMAKTLVRGLTPFRRQLVLPQLVNKDYSSDAANLKGDTITIPKYSGAYVTDVTPAQTVPAATALTPDTIGLTLDKWKLTTWDLDEKEMAQIDTADYLPKTFENQFIALADYVNDDLANVYKDVYNFHSDAGFDGTHKVPFDATDKVKSAIQARGLLKRNNVTDPNLHIVLSQSSEDNALGLEQFQNVNFSIGSLKEGEINRLLGFNWYTQSTMPLHTAGSANTGSPAINVSGTYAAGVKTVTMTTASSTATVVKGDLFTIAGDNQTYVVTAPVTLTTSGVSVSFEPELKVAISSGTPLVTITGNHTNLLAFSSDAFTIAFRQMANTSEMGDTTFVMFDPITRIPLRMKVFETWYKKQWALDVFYGYSTIRREAAVRIASLGTILG